MGGSLLELQKRLAALMEEQDVKAATLSTEAGLGKTAVRDILERTARSPEYFTVAKLADVLGVTPDYLVGRSEERRPVYDGDGDGDHERDRHIALVGSDVYMARVLEDLLELLANKGLISEDDLPDEARQLIERRRQLRGNSP